MCNVNVYFAQKIATAHNSCGELCNICIEIRHQTKQQQKYTENVLKSERIIEMSFSLTEHLYNYCSWWNIWLIVCEFQISTNITKSDTKYYVKRFVIPDYRIFTFYLMCLESKFYYLVRDILTKHQHIIVSKDIAVATPW